MKIGIIGLPNVGKSSLFNLLTQANAQVASFPFTTIDRNIGMASIPDERLDKIVEIVKPQKFRYATIEFVDIAGLIEGAHQGEGLGNKFLAHIRDVDLIFHILRCFAEPDIPHTQNGLNPESDYDIVRTELLLSDLEITERRIEKIHKKTELKKELNLLLSIKEDLSQGKVPQIQPDNLPLLSTKPEIRVLNIDEDGKFQVQIPGYRISVKLEQDITEFNEKEKEELRREAGVNPTGPAGLIRLALEKLRLILFYTIKGEETRAWPVKQGTRVFDAAGMIHTDIQKGFIKAEVLNFNDFITAGGFVQAQQKGLTKIEGKDYIIQDGDIILIKFRG